MEIGFFRLETRRYAGGMRTHRSARQWKREFEPNIDKVRGLIEGLLGGCVEILHFEDEFVAVVRLPPTQAPLCAGFFLG